MIPFSPKKQTFSSRQEIQILHEMLDTEYKLQASSSENGMTMVTCGPLMDKNRMIMLRICQLSVDSSSAGGPPGSIKI